MRKVYNPTTEIGQSLLNPLEKMHAESLLSFATYICPISQTP